MRRKIIYFTVLFLLLLSISMKSASAQNKFIEEEELNIVFVIDHSGSMNSLDEHNIIAEAIKAFIDTLQDENVQVGYVAYNDRVVASQNPLTLGNDGKRLELKNVIDSAQNRGETDIGLGLWEAGEMLDAYQGKGMIVLISDGETDLENSDTGRTKADSGKDIQETIQKCREGDVPITTIIFGGENESEAQEILSISQQTGGKNYQLQKPEELFAALCELFYCGPAYSIYEAGSSTYDEGSQKINYEVNGDPDEMMVLLLSDQDIRTVGISCEVQRGSIQKTERVEPEITGKYALAKVQDVKGNMSISFETGQKQKMMVLIIGRYNIVPVVKWKEELKKNKLLNFDIEFFREKEETVIALKETAGWKTEFVNLQTHEVIPAETLQSGQGLSGAVSFHSSGEYILRLSIQEGLPEIYEISGINIINTLPGSISSKEIGLLTVTKQQTVALNEYFADSDKDVLFFELQEVPEGLLKAEIKGDSLLIEPKGRGRGEIRLLISDGEGSLAGSIPVRVKSLPEAYWQVLLGLLCILGFCAFKMFRRRNKVILIPEKQSEKNENSFTGKLNAYFTILPAKMEEIPPLSFALHPIREKKIVLERMFSGYPELTDLLGLDKIYLFPAENRKLILYHDCDAAIMIGNSIVCRKMQYMVGYGNVIYITSKDGTCELEVHYISMI